MSILKQAGRTVVGLVTALMMLSGCGTLHQDTRTTSPEMADILKSRAITNWQLSTAGLNPLTPAESVSRAGELQRTDGLEVLALPPQPGAVDAWSYTIYLDHKTGDYWVVQQGGIGGSTTVYGPGHTTPQ